MSIIFKMPALSPTMVQGDIVRWGKSPGDTVESGETLLEIETDKAIMDFEATDSGELFHVFFPDQSKGVQVGTPVAILKEEQDTSEMLQALVSKIQLELNGSISQEPKNSTQAEGTKEVPEASPVFESTPEIQKASPAVAVSPERIHASPLAKKVAELEGVDLRTCSGSGPGGRIIKADVERVLQEKASVPLSKAPAHPVSTETGQHTITIPLTGMRGIIARRLTQAKQEIPHFYMRVACRMDALLALRGEINKAHAEGRISVNDFILKATALALKAFPAMNANVTGEGIQQFSKVGLSVAVSLNSGLITPIVQDAAEKSLFTLAREVRELVDRARSGKLLPHEYQGGTFTVSNLGMFQIEDFQAIINPPQVGILAVSATLEKPVVDHNQIIIAKVMNISLSSDHRAVDGVLAAQFIRKVQYYIENPLVLLAC